MTTENGWMKHAGGYEKLRLMVSVGDLSLDERRGMSVQQESKKWKWMGKEASADELAGSSLQVK